MLCELRLGAANAAISAAAQCPTMAGDCHLTLVMSHLLPFAAAIQNLASGCMLVPAVLSPCGFSQHHPWQPQHQQPKMGHACRGVCIILGDDEHSDQVLRSVNPLHAVELFAW
jgi:hypothetical protein